jgi:hypothetical protein
MARRCAIRTPIANDDGRSVKENTMNKMLLIATAAIAFATAANAVEKVPASIAALPAGHAKLLRPAQIEQSLKTQGFAHVSKVSYKQGLYTAQVLKAGQGWTTMTLNAVTGEAIEVN